MRQIIFLVCFCVFFSCKENSTKKDITGDAEFNPGPAKVEMMFRDGKYSLLVNKEPFYINGAGLEFGDVASLARHNGNSFRTWQTENGQKTALEVLDEARENGLMVTMGINVARERHGFDYNDENAVDAQLERIKKEVMKLKDHPALLIWGIGNELNLNYKNPKVWDAVNEISQMIHELDPNHLTTTSLSGISQKEINYIIERCPDLDILSIQMYGELPAVPKLIREYGWEGPYMITEWGATGHWEVPKTQWGAPIEEHSSLKAANYLKRYKKGIEADTLQCIGSYVFLWGNKQERTPTWYGIFLGNGQETESVDVMHYIWNEEWPDNRTPQIVSFTLDGKTAYDNVVLQANKMYNAEIKLVDFEDDAISYFWEVLHESKETKEGGDYEERPAAAEGAIISPKDGSVKIRVQEKGIYRLFVYADDGNNHSATANIPFMVN